MEGKRHGRKVAVTRKGRLSTVALHDSVPRFEAKVRDGRIKAGPGAARSVVAALAEVPSSTRWKGVKVSGGGGVIEVARGGDPSAWLCDLRLAERLAESI